jgi:hypothetical protein
LIFKVLISPSPFKFDIAVHIDAGELYVSFVEKSVFFYLFNKINKIFSEFV